MLFNIWSGPRCCSTALMYSFAQRTDTVVEDEPLYAAYLTLTGASRPYTDQVLHDQSADAEAVMERMDELGKSKHVYSKQMGKFVTCINRKWLKQGVHVVLVRDPVAVVNSFTEVLEATLEDTCYPALCTIISELRNNGTKPIVVLSEDLVRQPEATLRAMCGEMGIAFDPAMMSWQPGPKPYDGCWASWWYTAVHKSNGWGAPSSSAKPQPAIPEHLKPLLNECYAMYSLLLPYALSVQPPESEVDRVVHMPHASATPEGCEEAGQDSVEDDLAKKNSNVLIGLRDGANGRFSLAWRPAARVSALDAGLQHGRAVHETVVIHRGTPVQLAARVAQLFERAKVADILPEGCSFTTRACCEHVMRCIQANGMAEADTAAVRITMTEGDCEWHRVTTHGSADTNSGPSLVVLPQWLSPTAPSHVLLQEQRCSSTAAPAGAVGMHLEAGTSGMKVDGNTVLCALHIRPPPLGQGCENAQGTMVCVATASCERQDALMVSTLTELCKRSGIAFEIRRLAREDLLAADELFIADCARGLLPATLAPWRAQPLRQSGSTVESLQQAFRSALDEAVAFGNE